MSNFSSSASLLSFSCCHSRLRSACVLDAEERTVAVVVFVACVEQRRVLRADGQRQVVFERVKEDKVAENVPADREQKGMAAALETLEEVRAAETDEPLARARKVLHHLGFIGGWRLVRSGFEIIRQAVTRQVKQANRVHDFVGIEPGVLIVRVFVADVERERLGLALGEMETAAAFENEEATVCLGFGTVALGALVLSGQQHGGAVGAFGEGVVALHEAPGAAHHEQPHHFPPIVGVLALFESGEAIHGALMPAGKLVHAAIAIAPQILFGANANDVFGFEEQTQLVGEVEIRFVVRRCGKENAAAGVARNVIADDSPTAAFAISQVVALVNNNDAITAKLRQDRLGLGDGHHSGYEPIPMRVVLPHAHEVFRADDQRFERVRRVLKNPGKRRSHERFPKAHHITEDDAPALFKMPRSDADGGGLELQQCPTHIGGDGEFGKAGAGFLGQVVGQLDVNPVRRKGIEARPAFVNGLGQFLGDVHAPAVIPTVIKPVAQFVGGVVIEHVHIEFALVREAGECEIAAAEIASDGIIRVFAETEIELGVERMSKEEFDDQLAGLQLCRQTAQSRLVFVCGRAESQLLTEFSGKLAFGADDGLIADFALVWKEAVGFAQIILRQALHPNKQPTLMTFAAWPVLDQRIDFLPAAKIEIADGKIRMVGNYERLPQGGQKLLRDVVEDARMDSSRSSRNVFCKKVFWSSLFFR